MTPPSSPRRRFPLALHAPSASNGLRRLEVRLDRPEDAYITFGDGPHECLGKDLNIVFTTAIIKILARLKGLRRAPGPEGQLKSIDRAGGFKLYMDPDWSKFGPYPTSE